ncbi:MULTISPECIES: FimV/HubP family polar landmark protein [unclassified Pseudomonas]|uniref:FimV/HubP family polar landmark protein n=1 Tax=unclassified Pseudomonas TaxID=196821 RepID=UPI000876716F|nr:MULTISPECIES: FimV/HubP family polar landmark protein [unclassified Pseudomonas]SCZ28371.1 FimV C-terminal domain-containing protein [Pseudomonas sp. NFACC44-2]SDA76515.1 FimV C-terminal domain-containing protein [Pseudomonas sp. NFACC51]SEJ27656.1 FimV C-terminal domain-containing protein [Pseudomonas sp. NFACC07-1]SFH46893.1 FimV C-terminal domain-containing protein [Pseudomonas sp. NFACC54]SFT14159.1 FimV C-terminal domain-containing protein [Pseudomonas sp. NFACC48-1]
MLESLQSTLRSWVNVSVVVGALGYSALASALGLGDMTLHSALNQPLRADIALVDVAGIGEGDLSASLASPDDFSRAGVERAFFLNNLRFTPVLRGERSFIRVTSSKPVEEPFLNFLVQLNQPNGRLLREYTVLIDPPGTPGIVPVRDEPSEAPPSIKPPPAVQGKRYTVVPGDNPWLIAKRLHDAGSNASINELMQAIQALNPGSDRLSIGQRLLLPDSAVLPTSAATPAGQAPAASDEQLAASVLLNQQQQKTIEQLQARLQAQDEEVAGQRKQISELQARLAEVAPAPVASTQPQPALPASEPASNAQPATEPVAEPEGINWTWVAGLVGLLGLLALLLFVRRRQQQAELEPMTGRPEPMLEEGDETFASIPDTEPSENAASFNNGDTPLGDVLEGVGIYLTYGRFTEAAGLLRAALLAEPERTDLGLKLLEVLGKQGDVIGFQAQEHHLQAQGIDAGTLEEVRGRYPKVSMIAAPTVASVPSQVPALSSTPTPAPEREPVPGDEFELDLDALSMETSWDLADAQDNTADKEAVSPYAAESFSLSGFDEPDLQWEAPLETESLDDAFLDSFADEEQSLELEPLALEPVSLDTLSLEPQAPEHSVKLEQAQNCIDDGDLKTAVSLLEELLEEGDEPLKETARVLLAGIR